MTEAQEIASNFHPPYPLRTFTAAETWLKAAWPDWRDYVGMQTFDVVAEALVTPEKA
jgi:hypothetical protein